MIFAAVVLVTGCSAHQESERPVGMANPASVYCIDQGGKLEMVKTPEGEVGYCNLPSGERIEEWALFRRNHHQ